jgi:two-component system CheB/CheR fusion protein
MPKAPGAVSPQRVVGIGASAGGLEALKQLVIHLPVDTGLAFVVLQHLPPSQIGQLTRLLASWATLPVSDVRPRHHVEPNTILVVPPHTSAALSRGSIVLRASRAGARPRRPIDGLLSSLASVLGDRAIGVVLSGTANDGTEGLRAIRAAGGLTIAQDPSTAQFDEMPRSAIAAGVADTVASPGHIADAIAGLARAAAPSRARRASPIDSVLVQLREASGIDFTSYKRSTIERRLERRLAKLGLTTLEQYSAYLEAHTDEARKVYEDLLIHVTEFFRDGTLLERLVAHVVPHVSDRPADAPVRVWVPGCSTGEELYSLAILLIEAFGPERPLQLFGSDLSEKAIETARAGRYSGTAVAQLSAARMERFFRREDGGYRIARDVRDRCVFVRHDLVSDPPISKLDLISCRNLMIYLGPELQQRIVPLFHYALNQPGFLLLGRGEALPGFESMFELVDSEARIYARKKAVRASLTFPLAGQLGRQPWRRGDALRSHHDVQADVDRVLLARYAPPSVLVDDNLDVIQFRGSTGEFLEAPSGQPQLNVLKMARDSLVSELPLVLQRARTRDIPVRKDNLSVNARGRTIRFNLEVIPLRAGPDVPRHFLIVFEPIEAKAPRGRASSPKPIARGETARLREELAATKEYLHTMVVQHRVTGEELGVVNEELQSTNEELQSTNEELQTAKEELQSTNEELETVNEELQHGNALLREVNDDLINVLASVEIAIIMVDNDRHVRRFTPRARAMVNLIPTDIGRPIADLKPIVAAPWLDDEIARVIETLAVHEAEVDHPDGTSYRMQIRPYRTADHKIAGAVVTFVDITALRAARDFTASIVEAVPTPLAVIDRGLRVRTANRTFRAAFGAPADRELRELGDWRSPDLEARLRAAFDSDHGFDDVEVDFHGAHGVRALRLGARVLPGSVNRGLLLLGIADITEERAVEAAGEAAAREHDAFLDAVSHELRTPLSAILLWAQALRGLAPDDPRRVEALDTIVESAQAEARLIDDLIELAMSRTGELRVSIETVDAGSALESAVASVREQADEKRLALEVELASRPKIRADARRLQQILGALIGNAIKFTPSGGRVHLAMTAADGKMELRIRDTGEGIPREFLPHVFEAFSQTDRSTTRPHRGLGVGLALVRHLVVRQGGTIDVASAGHGEGATFTVRLPLAT